MKSILDHKAVSQKYFYPRHASFPDPFFVTSGNNQLACYYYKIENPKKTIIHFHGNGEVVADYFNFFEREMEALGCSTLFAEYRQYGLSTGDAPSLVEMLDDVEQIIKSIDIPPEEIILFGRSVGSIYALHGASIFPNIAGLVIESGISDVVVRIFRLIKPKKKEMEDEVIADGKKYFDHKKKLESFKGKTLIMHTLHDTLVSSSNARELYRWANEPKKLNLFELGDHNNVMFANKEEYIGLLDEFIGSLEH